MKKLPKKDSANFQVVSWGKHIYYQKKTYSLLLF